MNIKTTLFSSEFEQRTWLNSKHSNTESYELATVVANVFVGIIDSVRPGMMLDPRLRDCKHMQSLLLA